MRPCELSQAHVRFWRRTVVVEVQRRSKYPYPCTAQKKNHHASAASFSDLAMSREVVVDALRNHGIKLIGNRPHAPAELRQKLVRLCTRRQRNLKHRGAFGGGSHVVWAPVGCAQRHWIVLPWLQSGNYFLRLVHAKSLRRRPLAHLKRSTW